MGDFHSRIRRGQSVNDQQRHKMGNEANGYVSSVDWSGKEVHVRYRDGTEVYSFDHMEDCWDRDLNCWRLELP